MKKILSLVLCISLLSASTIAFSANEMETDTVVSLTDEAVETSETSDVTAMPTTATQNRVSVTATVSKPLFMKESEAKIELLSSDGKSLGEKTAHISSDTDTVVFEFDVPEYTIGTSFKIRAVDGLDCIVYYTDRYYVGSELTFPTYSYIDDNGNVTASTDVAVTINPLYDKSINLYYDGKPTGIWGARIIDGVTMVPAEALAKAVGYDTKYDSTYNTQIISIADKYMFFNVGTDYTTIFGADVTAQHPTVMIDNTVYIALRTYADNVGVTLDVKDNIEYLDIYMGKDPYLEQYYNSMFVNRSGISSRTSYLVWVSLSEYKTRVYQGSQYKWRPILEATCAIGAPSTPTVTGSFEYNYKTRWDYGSYYVGPCLVFYRGYALHSVLLWQNGTEYDGRVGMKLSHGCIRLKKKDIDFIASTIPVGTRIYITP